MHCCMHDSFFCKKESMCSEQERPRKKSRRREQCSIQRPGDSECSVNGMKPIIAKNILFEFNETVNPIIKMLSGDVAAKTILLEQAVCFFSSRLKNRRKTFCKKTSQEGIRACNADQWIPDASGVSSTLF